MKNDSKIIDAHWTNGGTAITNFTADRLLVYRLAIRSHGDPSFRIENKTFHPHTWKGYSLHRVGGPQDCSGFWQAFEKVRSGEYVENSKITLIDHLEPEEVKSFMRKLASDISERCYCARWMDGLEFALWEAIMAGNPFVYGVGTIARAESAVLKTMADSLGMWFDPRPGRECKWPCGRKFMPMEKWLELYEKE